MTSLDIVELNPILVIQKVRINITTHVGIPILVDLSIWPKSQRVGCSEFVLYCRISTCKCELSSLGHLELDVKCVPSQQGQDSQTKHIVLIKKIDFKSRRVMHRWRLSNPCPKLGDSVKFKKHVFCFKINKLIIKSKPSQNTNGVILPIKSPDLPTFEPLRIKNQLVPCFKRSNETVSIYFKRLSISRDGEAGQYEVHRDLWVDSSH